jgi:hypothetical protein
LVRQRNGLRLHDGALGLSGVPWFKQRPTPMVRLVPLRVGLLNIRGESPVNLELALWS